MIQGEAIWTPPADWRRRFEMGRYVEWLRLERGLDFPGYDELWHWSVTDLEGFWASIWDYFGVRAHTPYERVLGSREMPGAEWFPGATLNFAEHMLGRDEDLDSVAIVAHSQTRETRELTFGELREQVGTGARRPAAARGRPRRPRRRLPPEHPGDGGRIPRRRRASARSGRRARPSSASAASSTGWASSSPKVLLAVGGYVYGEKLDRPCRERRRDPRARCPRSRRSSTSSTPAAAIPGAIPWDELLGEPGPLEFDPVPFAHPLYVLFSSGTTGLPKAIVHGHGGILLEHLKNLGLGVGRPPGRPPPVVHDDRLDDVERARLGAAPAGVDRDARRQPRVSRPRSSSGSWPRRPGRR